MSLQVVLRLHTAKTRFVGGESHFGEYVTG